MKKLLLTLVFFMYFAMANATVQVKEGVDYTVIPSSGKVSKTKTTKVNVKEFFSFNCIHCKDVEPLVQQYIATNKNVEMEQIQAVWGSDVNMLGFAKLNATIALLKLNRLYVPAFDVVFARQNINDPAVLKTFLATNRLTPTQITNFMDRYNSFEVSTIVGKYKTMTADPQYQLEGTPTFVVADKYIVKPAQPPRLMEVVQALVTKVQSSK